MNKTQKILLAIGVGVGVAYLYRRYMMPKKSASATITDADISSTTTTTSETEPTSRSEKEEYILDNAMASEKETMSGMDGVSFVFNPKLGKFYPKGTLTYGQEPAYYESIFYSADGDMKTNVPNAVENAESTLANMTDQELELAYRIVKYCKENPDARGDMKKVIKGMNITNPRLIEFINKKLNKSLNDIKIAKKDASWNEKWAEKKEMRKKRRKDFFDKVGVEKGVYDKAVAKSCGKPKRNVRLSADAIAKYRQCSENVASKLRDEAKNQVREAISNAPVIVKSDINNARQNQFSQQVINRQGARQFAGKREDGRNNNYTETLVSEGLV
jgi:hypothetical protein